MKMIEIHAAFVQGMFGESDNGFCLFLTVWEEKDTAAFSARL